ncbi:hypothetical protein HMPREF0970_01008 [Schaalia odontolytica F0309]|uniref:Uncharacterized protein n=1 Tax=Schaalia odontolytica F0309 TaxID=649742 RepID=D4TYI3_9ACTO|nr:hypothetical protein HMPREF0970_01008 [Schaalia odontolytica F0309]
MPQTSLPTATRVITSVTSCAYVRKRLRTFPEIQAFVGSTHTSARPPRPRHAQ